jgi:hypothetical protein
VRRPDYTLLARAAYDRNLQGIMLFTEAALKEILDGIITLAFRRWRMLRVRKGSTFRTSHGVIAVSSIEDIDLEDISEADARHAGFEQKASATAEGLGIDREPRGWLSAVAARARGPGQARCTLMMTNACSLHIPAHHR